MVAGGVNERHKGSEGERGLWNVGERPESEWIKEKKRERQKKTKLDRWREKERESEQAGRKRRGD